MPCGAPGGAEQGARSCGTGEQHHVTDGRSSSTCPAARRLSWPCSRAARAGEQHGGAPTTPRPDLASRARPGWRSTGARCRRRARAARTTGEQHGIAPTLPALGRASCARVRVVVAGRRVQPRASERSSTVERRRCRRHG